MQAGRLASPITIQSPSESRNGIGDVLVTWSDLAVVWCEFTNIVGRERFATFQEQGQIVAVARTRFRDDITPKMRAIFDGRTYLIRGVWPVKGRREAMDLALEEFPDG
jgi:SPP1 family predicted phage head-tail adaptor